MIYRELQVYYGGLSTFVLSLQLEVEDLQDAIQYMHKNKKYKKVKSITLLLTQITFPDIS